MYTDHFKLDRNPFPSTPQLDFFYSGGGRDAAVNAIDFALEENFGIIKIIGQTGCGKTMLCRQTYRQFSEKYDVLFLSDPTLDSAHSILSAVASELNPEWDTNKPKNKLFQKVMQTLIQQRKAEKPTILIIEEAHKITPSQFEELRYLTNLETSQDKLLQIILFGQPSLDANLLKTDVQLLAARLTHSIFLRPLYLDEFTQYVYYRLGVSGLKTPETLFSKTILTLVHFLSNGSLRHGNQLLEKTLFSCYLRKKTTPSLIDLAAAIKGMSRVGAQIRYTRVQLASVFSVGLFFGWIAFTATTPLTIDQQPMQNQASTLQTEQSIETSMRE